MDSLKQGSSDSFNKASSDIGFTSLIPHERRIDAIVYTLEEKRVNQFSLDDEDDQQHVANPNAYYQTEQQWYNERAKTVHDSQNTAGGMCMEGLVTPPLKIGRKKEQQVQTQSMISQQNQNHIRRNSLQYKQRFTSEHFLTEDSQELLRSMKQKVLHHERKLERILGQQRTYSEGKDPLVYSRNRKHSIEIACPYSCKHNRSGRMTSFGEQQQHYHHTDSSLVYQDDDYEEDQEQLQLLQLREQVRNREIEIIRLQQLVTSEEVIEMQHEKMSVAVIERLEREIASLKEVPMGTTITEETKRSEDVGIQKLSHEQRLRFRVGEQLGIHAGWTETTADEQESVILDRIHELLTYRRANASFTNQIITTLRSLASPDAFKRTASPSLVHAWKFIKRILNEHVGLVKENERLQVLTENLAKIVDKSHQQ